MNTCKDYYKLFRSTNPKDKIKQTKQFGQFKVVTTGADLSSHMAPFNLIEIYLVSKKDKNIEIKIFKGSFTARAHLETWLHKGTWVADFNSEVYEVELGRKRDKEKCKLEREASYKAEQKQILLDYAKDNEEDYWGL